MAIDLEQLIETVTGQTELKAEDGAEQLFGEMLQYMKVYRDRLSAAQRTAEVAPDLPEHFLDKDWKIEPIPFNSTTGQVLVLSTDEGECVVIKSLRPSNEERTGFLERPAPHYYKTDDAAARVMMLAGEMYTGRDMNDVHAYHGLAGMTFTSKNVVRFVPLKEAAADIHQPDVEIVMVMPYFQAEDNLGEMMLELAREREITGSLDQDRVAYLNGLTTESLGNVFKSATLVEPAVAKENNSPDALKKLLLNFTTKILSEYPSDNPEVMKAKERLKEAEGFFRWFFALKETKTNLTEMEKECVLSVGDAKPFNTIVTQENGNDQTVGLDAQFLIMMTDRLIMAPWPFTHPMQIGAYHATTAVGLGIPQMYKHAMAVTKEHTQPERWKSGAGWFELYFAVLTAYKMFIEVAVNIENYLDTYVTKQEEDEVLRLIMTEFPDRAVELLKDAEDAYFF